MLKRNEAKFLKRNEAKVVEAKRSKNFEAKRSEKLLRKLLKRNEAKILKRNEAKRSEKMFLSFAKQSENQGKRDAVSLFSLRSEKIKQAKMGHPNGLFATRSFTNIIQGRIAHRSNRNLHERFNF